MIGKTISHYKILEKLGEGGMGVVYKAEDTKLKRVVALKFLPPEITRDQDAKKRFVREAQAASALQHNNICTIHEIDETPDGRMFICMDYYTGETVREKIKRGPLPPAEAIDIAINVAGGLAIAHEAGMVHRDIKPANLVVTSGGVVKVVDFGLAQLAGTTRVTKTGTAVGTVAYMSPEQAGGRQVDARSDVFSLGVVLYELLTGVLPFPGDHDAAVLYGIMHSDPKPMSEYGLDIPEALQSVIDRALQKETGERYQTVSELQDELEVVEHELVGVKRKRRRATAHSIGTRTGLDRRAVLALATGVVIIGAATVFLVPRFTNSPVLVQPSPRITPLVTGEGLMSAPQWSPSENMIAFEAREGSAWDVWVSDLDGAQPLNLTATPHSTDRYPAWSPNGQRIAFYSDRDGPGIYTMTVTGGGVRRIVDVDPGLVELSLLHLRWVEGDRLIFGNRDVASRADTYEFSLRDRSLRCLTCSQPNGAFRGELSPSGEFLAFVAPLLGTDVEILVQRVDAEETHSLSLLGRQVCWAPDGESLFVISTLEGSWDLWTVAIDSRSGAQKGEPRRLTSGASLSDISFSPTGDRALGDRHAGSSGIWVFPTNEGRITSLDTGERVASGEAARWMPSGAKIVYQSGRRGEQQVWTRELGSGRPVRLSEGFGGYPIVSPDGRWIAYGAMDKDGRLTTHVVRPGGSDLHPLYSEVPEEYTLILSTDWSKDGRHIAYHTVINGEWMLGVAAIQLESGTVSEMGLIGVKGSIPFWSPAGGHLVYQRTEDEKPDLYVTTVDGDDIYRLTDDPAKEWVAGWSSKPSFIYYGRMEENGDKDVYRIAMDDTGRPKSDPELWMAFPPPIRLGQYLDFHNDRALGRIDDPASYICLIEFEKTSSR
jgi:serine/threonine protein kinase